MPSYFICHSLSSRRLFHLLVRNDLGISTTQLNADTDRPVVTQGNLTVARHMKGPVEG
jgi:hypothetical protein